MAHTSHGLDASAARSIPYHAVAATPTISARRSLPSIIVPGELFPAPWDWQRTSPAQRRDNKGLGIEAWCSPYGERNRLVVRYGASPREAFESLQRAVTAGES